VLLGAGSADKSDRIQGKDGRKGSRDVTDSESASESDGIRHFFEIRNPTDT